MRHQTCKLRHTLKSLVREGEREIINVPQFARLAEPTELQSGDYVATCISVVRLSWDVYFKEIVQVTATRSPCERLQVGCLLVNENRIIAQGYNGFLPGCPHESIVRDGHEQATLHAEQNALMDCAKRGVSCKGAIAYITHYPCVICCRLLLAAGITHIKYIHPYRNDPLVEHFTTLLGVPIDEV